MGHKCLHNYLFHFFSIYGNTIYIKLTKYANLMKCPEMSLIPVLRSPSNVSKEFSIYSSVLRGKATVEERIGVSEINGQWGKSIQGL